MQQFAAFRCPRRPVELVRDAQELVRDAYQHLLWSGGAAICSTNDDTPMRVLELKGKTQRQQPLLEEAPSGAVSSDRRGILASGRRPSLCSLPVRIMRRNLPHVLEHRVTELPPPIQMCDALSRICPTTCA